MENAEIDVHGVRAGDVGALNMFSARRGASVLAYCNQVCGPQIGPAAAAESFARTRAVLRDDANVAAVDTDQLLRRATRHTAASAARTPQGPPPTGAIPGRETTTCLDVAISLAAASDGRLDEDQRRNLRAHIDHCEQCAALAEITRRADAAYTDPLNDRVGLDHAERFTAAMQAIPATGPSSAPPPVGEPATPARPLFPILPPLADERSLDGVEAPAAAEVIEISAVSERRGLGRLLRGRRSSAADSAAA